VGGQGSSGAFLDTALNPPISGAPAPGQKPTGYVATERISDLELGNKIFGDYRCICLCGVGQIQEMQAAQLEKFVQQGGTLITLGASSYFPAEFGLTRTVDAAHPSAQFYAPGPIVEAQILRPAHPIFYGYTDQTIPVRYAGGPLLRVPAEGRRWVLMQYPGTDKSVLSGLFKGVAEIRNHPAILDVPTGQGRVVLFATNPAYRWQNQGEFGMLANAIMHWDRFPKPETGPPERPNGTGAGPGER